MEKTGNAVSCTFSMDPGLVEKIDATAKQMGMSRSRFLSLFMEITFESEMPTINFAMKLGSAYRAIWPKYKLSKKDLETA